MSAALEHRDYIGARYRGSIEEAHGAIVLDMWDCPCCYRYGGGRVSATVKQGGQIFRMDHARPTSFELPYGGKLSVQ